MKLSINDFYFTHRIVTRFRDMDTFNHINNAVFLSYAEDARILFFKRWNIDYKERSLIVASAKVDYIKQLNHPSEIVKSSIFSLLMIILLFISIAC